MAHCVISAVFDTDGETVVPACIVHTYYAPCPRNGEPASAKPLHGDDRLGEQQAVEFWARQTDRQRPLVVHHGSIGDDDHNLEGWDCPCLPSHYSAEEADAIDPPRAVREDTTRADKGEPT